MDPPRGMAQRPSRLEFRQFSALGQLADAHYYLGEYDTADAINARVLEHSRALYGHDHPRVASALNALGWAALQQGRLDEAEARFTRMLAIYREVYEAGHYLVGIATSNLASVLTEKKTYSDAERLSRQAIAIYEHAQSPTHLNTGIGHQARPGPPAAAALPRGRTGLAGRIPDSRGTGNAVGELAAVGAHRSRGDLRRARQARRSGQVPRRIRGRPPIDVELPVMVGPRSGSDLRELLQSQHCGGIETGGAARW